MHAKLVRDSFTLDRETSARAQRLARRTGMSRSFIYRAAVKEYLLKHEPGAITAAVNAALGDQPQDASFVEGAHRALSDANLIDEWSE